MKKTPLASALSRRAGRQAGRQAGRRITAESGENTKMRKCGNSESRQCGKTERRQNKAVHVQPWEAKKAKPSTHARDAFFFLSSALLALFSFSCSDNGSRHPTAGCVRETTLEAFPRKLALGANCSACSKKTLRQKTGAVIPRALLSFVLILADTEEMELKLELRP